MISKIIQKEKERQEMWLPGCNWEETDSNVCCKAGHYICLPCAHIQAHHKLMLINLKEYMEETLENYASYPRHHVELTEDIKELTKMIERYK